MTSKRVLYISGSLGLGHVVRDLAIARELRRQNPGLDISWLAGPPARDVLADAGETLHPQSAQYGDLNNAAEQVAAGYALSLDNYWMGSAAERERNLDVFRRVLAKERFYVAVGDGTYEIWWPAQDQPELLAVPFVMMYDFVGGGYVTWRQRLKMLLGESKARGWGHDHKLLSRGRNMLLFVGEPEDIPNARYGFMRANKRRYGQKYYHFTGHVLGFDPAEHSDRAQAKKALGYDQRPLVVCSIGGTSIGKGLLELCGRACSTVQETISDLHMVLVCGPRLDPTSLSVLEGVEVRGYVPALYKHFAACDLAIVHAGGTSTIELMALRRPFLCFPLEGHSEQERDVAGRIARHGAGVKMSLSETTPELLAQQIIANLGREVTYRPLRTDGAQSAAELINGFLLA